MLFESSVLLRCPSPLKCTKRHSKLRRSTATTSMTRWSFPLHWNLDARLSIPKTFTMARQLMDNSPFEIPSLDHPASSLYNFKSNAREYKQVRDAISIPTGVPAFLFTH